MLTLGKTVVGMLALAFFLACGGGGGEELSPGPTKFGVTAMDRNLLDLGWIRPSQGADAYNIEQSVNGGSFTTVKTVSGDTSDTFLDTSNLPDDGQIRFRVYGTRGGSRTANSNEDSYHMWVRPPGNVAASLDPSADGKSVGTITLTWTRTALALNSYRIERIVGNATQATTMATVSAQTLRWTDSAPVEAANSTYYVSTITGSAVSDPTPSNVMAIPALTPVITSVVAQGTLVTLSWEQRGIPADQVVVMSMAGFGTGSSGSYSTEAKLAGDATTYATSNLPFGYTSLLLKVIKGGIEGYSEPYSLTSAPAVPGMAFDLQRFSIPTVSVISLAPSGGCFAQTISINPPKCYEVTTSGYKPYVMNPGDQVVSAAVYDAAENPHFFSWQKDAQVSGQLDLMHIYKENSQWLSESVGTTTTVTVPRFGVAFIGGSGKLHFFFQESFATKHITNASGTWGEESLSAPNLWAYSLDDAGLPRVYIRGNSGESALGQLGLQDAANQWTYEAIPSPFTVGTIYWADIVPLPEGRLGLAIRHQPHASGTFEYWWFERDGAGQWDAGMKLPVVCSSMSEDALLISNANHSRTAMLLGRNLCIRDGSGIWNSGPFCPDGYDMGWATMAFNTNGKLMVVARAGVSYYAYPDPYILYTEH